MTRPPATPAMIGSLMELFIGLEAKARRMAQASTYEPVAVRRKPGPKRNATDAQILEAYATGLTIDQVAAKLKTGNRAVSAVVGQAGVMRKQGKKNNP